MDGSTFNISNASVERLRGSTIAKPQKAFAIAFAVLATALAGCASSLGANSADRVSVATVARVEDGTVVGASTAVQSGPTYIVRLRSGELVSIPKAGDQAIATGTPVLIKFGADARVIPQNSSIGYL